jgi:hypothetical protein
MTMIHSLPAMFWVEIQPHVIQIQRPPPYRNAGRLQTNSNQILILMSGQTEIQKTHKGRLLFNSLSGIG